MKEFPTNIDFSSIKDFNDLKNRVSQFDFNENGNNIYIIKKGSIIKVDEIPGLTLKQKSKFNIGNIIVCHENTKFDSCQILLGKKSGFVCGPTPNPVRKLNAHMQWATNNIISIGHTFSCQGVMFKIYGANVFIGNNNMFSWGITIFTGDGHCIYNRDGNRINNNADVFFWK